jgi:protein SCO1/2
MIGLLLAACYGGDAYIVKGAVVEVHAPREVLLDHEAIPGLMGPMVMPFEVDDPALLDGLKPGDLVTARYVVRQQGSGITDLRVTGHGPPPEVSTGPAPVRVGERIAATPLPLDDGTTLTLGPDQPDRVALTFLYTRCPNPEFCPAMVARLQALQQALGEPEGARIVAVTLDPDHDTLDVLRDYGKNVGAGPRWRFGRLDVGPLADLSMRAGLPVMRENGEIAHGLRLLVLDRGGTLIERYDDANFPIDRVVQQLTTGAPLGDPANSGTVTSK